MAAPRQLLLLRHGAAADGARDAERPLTDGGKRDAQRIGAALATRGRLPAITIASPAVRARRTAEKALKAAGLTVGSLRIEPAIYRTKTLWPVISGIDPTHDRAMIVGHNPSIEATLETLTGAHHPVSSGTLAIIELEAWSSRDGALALLIRPDDLPRRFPYPLRDPVEERPRPAYYYRQSAVIPYRFTGGGALEVLIIGSSKRKSWVVPKGIVEPGLSEQASAAKEALEEAGIEGRVSDDALGHIEIRKWGAICHCAVYAMEVERELPASQWRERHRGRAWVAPAEAVSKLKGDELPRMVTTLAERLSRRATEGSR